MKIDDIFEYIEKNYNTLIEHPWEKYPEHIVLKHPENKKWYGLIMNVEKETIGLKGTKKIQILNIKCYPEMICQLRLKKCFLPAYHMNKEHWITIVLEEADAEEVMQLIDISYELTK